MFTGLFDGFKDVILLFDCASFIDVDHNSFNFERCYVFLVIWYFIGIDQNNYWKKKNPKHF